MHPNISTKQYYINVLVTVSKYNDNFCHHSGIKTGCNVVSAYHVAQCVSLLYCLSWCVNNFHQLPFSAQSEATLSSSGSYTYLIVNSGFKRKPQCPSMAVKLSFIELFPVFIVNYTVTCFLEHTTVKFQIKISLGHCFCL